MAHEEYWIKIKSFGYWRWKRSLVNNYMDMKNIG
jgi:hypothetical protein